ncbi:hypothetical protein [Streptomyces atacamensis]|jgi:hypothetical protein|uniref:hypothetical protein n=1 Tax=Streptomyces atacamensis TaxID=531966 RepID=UPI00399C95F0
MRIRVRNPGGLERFAEAEDADRMDSIGDWYAEYDLPGGDPARAPNYYHSEDDDPIDYPREVSLAGTHYQSPEVDPFECAGCGHTHPENLDERGLCPYCRDY